MRLLAALALLFFPLVLCAQIPVLHREGTLHGFLALRAEEGELLASGELLQVARGDRVTVHLVFHFKDGSLIDDTAVYTERRSFRLVTDHLIHKGASFPHPIDMFVDVAKKQVTVRYREDGKEQVTSEHMDLPPNLANGIIPTLMRNVKPEAGETELALVVATPKPRLIKLKASVQGEDTFTLGGTPHKATNFVVKIELGGLKGVIAPVIGKQPPDSHLWIMEGEAPAFLKSEGPQFQDGPIWQIELASPAWPKEEQK